MRLARLVAAATIALAALFAAAGLFAAGPAAFASTTGLASTTGHASVAVLAHAALASTQPADGSVVRKSPQQVSASFDEAVGISADSLVVYSPSGQRVEAGQAFHVTAYEVAVDLLPDLGNGTYTGVWHVISADTHPVRGAFTFSVGAPSATHVGALLPAADPVVSDLFTVVRWLEYLCFALLGGGVAFLIICWPEGSRRKDVGRLVTVSSLGLLLSTLAGLLLQGPYGAGAGLSQVFSAPLVRATFASSLGPASEAREVLSLLAAGIAAFMLPRLPAATLRARRAYGAVWALLITAVAGSWAVYDHASTGVQSPWGIPDDIVHLDAMTLWIGGLAMLAGVALRGQEIRGGPGAAALARAVPRFSVIAFGAVAALVASGVYQTWREVGAWGALFDTAYGRLVLAKTAGLLVLLALGYLARRYIQRSLPHGVPLAGSGRMPLATGAARVTGPLVIAGYGDAVTADAVAVQAAGPAVTGSGPRSAGGPGRVWALAMRRLRRSVAVELGVAVVILALTALLVNTATGREAYAPTVSASQGFDTGGPGGAGIAHVFAAPARLGPNTIEVYFTKADGQAFLPAQVTAALYFSTKGLGPLPVTLTRTAPGQYRAQDATVTFTGQWTLQVIVRSDEFDETSVTFPLGIH
ncbi:MAG TPA: FixH family protein [Trebonia sp.]|nr:FixH family protein [Trebonia sp.]